MFEVFITTIDFVYVNRCGTTAERPVRRLPSRLHSSNPVDDCQSTSSSIHKPPSFLLPPSSWAWVRHSLWL